MNRKLFLFVSLIALSALVWSASGPALASPAAASALTGYYNLLGYEGIGTLGGSSGTHGVAPAVGDYGFRHCRYINIASTTLGDYYLRYPLHLPNGATITKVSLFVADFNGTGALWAYLRSEPWNSHDQVTLKGFTTTGDTGDQTINITPSVGVTVNNQTTAYRVDVSPQNSADPGQLCVYGIQVTYTYNGAFLPLIQR